MKSDVCYLFIYSLHNLDDNLPIALSIEWDVIIILFSENSTPYYLYIIDQENSH